MTRQLTWACKLLIVCFAGVTSVIALNCINQLVSGADIREAARLLERGARFNPDRLRSLALQATAIATGGTCNSVILRSASAVVLHDLDNQNSVRDYENWGRSISNARDVLNATSACLPTNGNIYLRLAMVEWKIAALDRRNAYLLSLSKIYAPFELDVIKARLLVWERLDPVYVKNVKAEFSSDFHLLKSHTAEFHLSKQRTKTIIERLENTYRSADLLKVSAELYKTRR